MILNKRFLKWLKSELPTLIDADILSEFQAHRLWEHYYQQWRTGRKKFLRYITAIVGLTILSAIVLYLIKR